MRSALTAIASVIASFCIVWIVCTRLGLDASPAILSAALAVSLTRDTAALSWRRFVRALVALPLVALAAGAVGLAFHISFVLGAVLFSLCVALSVYLRRFGPRASALGRIIALPFIAMLVVPVRPAGTPLVTALTVIGAGVVAVCCTTLFRLATRAKNEPSPSAPRTRERAPRSIDPPTRMALQMLASLALGFAAGGLLFPQHWFWVVLTAFIVCSGAVARGDAVHKGISRLAGAIGGTFAAALLPPLESAPPALRAGMIFVVLFAAMTLRERNYAYWAAGVTLIFALLQTSSETPPLVLFGERVLAIALGACCAIVATWVVFPLRSEAVVKRRIADLLSAHKRGDTVAIEQHLRELDRAVAPMMLHRRVFRRMGDERHPAALAERAREFVRRPAKAAVLTKSDVVVHVSVAMTIDGYIDDSSEQRLVLSHADDMERVRAMRAQYDAIFVGAGTVRADNPSLRTLAQLQPPIRVTVTRTGNLDPDSRFFDGSARTIVLAPSDVAAALRDRLGDRAEVYELGGDGSPQAMLDVLQGLGIRSLFVEGGTRVLTAFLASGTFDRLRLAVAPFFAGGRGGARVVDPAVFADDADHRLVLVGMQTLGDMAILEYERATS